MIASLYSCSSLTERLVGTMGQDPTKRQHIDAKSWVVIIVCALATCQGIIGAIAAGSNQFAITGE